MIKVKYWVRTNRVGSTCEYVLEFDREAWEGMSEEEREAVMREAAFENMDWGFEVQDESE